MLEFLRGKRTLIFNSAMAVVLIYNVIVPDAPITEAEVTTFVDQVIDHLDALITIVGNVILRFFTKTAVFKKV